MLNAVCICRAMQRRNTQSRTATSESWAPWKRCPAVLQPLVQKVLVVGACASCRFQTHVSLLCLQPNPQYKQGAPMQLYLETQVATSSYTVVLVALILCAPNQ